MNISEHGGRRPGQGHPTEHAQDRSREAASTEGRKKPNTRAEDLQEMFDAIPKEKWQAMLDRAMLMAEKGNMKMMSMLLAYGRGRPATQANVPEDTEIHLHVSGVIPRPWEAISKVAYRELYDGITGTANKAFCMAWMRKYGLERE